MSGGGALKVGDVYVVVSAAIGEFSKSMQSVLKTVESTAKKVKEAAKGIGEVGAIAAAGMGAALLASSQTNAAVAADLQRLKDYVYTFAAELGDALAPYLRQIADGMGRLLAAFQRLPPGTKEVIAKVVAFMAAVGGLGMVTSKAAGLVEGLAKAAGIVLVPALNAASSAAKLVGVAFKETGAGKALLSGMKGMEAGVGQAVARMALSFAGLLVPILAVVAAVAVVALAAGALYEAWNDAGTGMKATVMDIWQGAKDLGARLFDTVAGWVQALQAGLLKALRVVLELVAGQVRQLARMLAPLARWLKLDSMAGLLDELSNLTGDQLLKDLQAGATFLAEKAQAAGGAVVDAAKAAGQNIVTSVNYGAKGLKRMWNDSGAPKWLDKLLGGGGGETGPRVRVSGKTLKERAKLDKEIADQVSKAAEESAEELRKAMAAEERAAAASWSAIADDNRALAEAVAARVAEVKASLVDKALGALGNLGSIIQDARAYAASGPDAMLASVMIDLLSQSQGFKDVMEIVNSIIQSVADALGRLFTALQPLLAALSMIIDAGLQVLGPLFEALGSIIAPLVPPLVVLGTLFQALAPVITVLVQVILVLMNPLQLLAGPVMRGLFEVLKFVAGVVLRVAKAIADAWNWIVHGVQSILKMLDGLPIVGDKIGDFADSLDRFVIDTDGMADSIAELNDLTWESAKAKAEEIAETIKNRDALKDVNEQLSNVPRGFKIALERFRAQDPVTGLPLPSIPGVPPTAPPPAARPPGGGVESNPAPGPGGGPDLGERFGGLIQWGNVTITGVDPQQALQQLERTAENLLRRVLGNRGAMFPFSGGGG
jgi:phage-related protein